MLKKSDNAMGTEAKAQPTNGEVVLSAISAAAQELAGFFTAGGRVVDAIRDLNQAFKELDPEDEEDYVDAEYRESKS